MANALLVDLDGTLVDTSDANFEAYAAALREVGVAVERAEFDRLSLGRSWKHFLPPLLAGSDVPATQVAQRKRELYPAYLPLTKVNEGVRRLVSFAHAAWKTALVTTASRANVDAILAHHGLASLFDEIVAGEDVTHPKPDPEAYRLAGERLGVEAGACIALEDTDVGVESAIAFGAAVLRVQMLESMRRDRLAA